MKKKTTIPKTSVIVLVGFLLIPATVFSRTLYSHLPTPPSDNMFHENARPNADKVKLGKLLFFDKILSGNLNISCATCHHALTDTGDGLSLPVGEGGRGLGVTRDTGSGTDAIHERVPRNAPPIFNLGAKEFVRMFHDGRVEVDLEHPSGFNSPAGDQLPPGLENALAAQAMFPVTSAAEMAGQSGENAQADAAAENDLTLLWELIAQKLRDIPEYVELFKAAFPGEVINSSDLTYAHAANAIAAFEAKAWRFDNSPFYLYLKGNLSAMGPAAKRGMRLFYNRRKGNCASCHSGTFQTDHNFHAIAMPPIGAGKGDNQEGYADGHDDFGRERVTGDAADRFKFRTPTLSNVELTAPYGHDGAYNTLEGVVRHHLNAKTSLRNYDRSEAILTPRDDLDAKDFVVIDDDARLDAIADASEIRKVRLRKREVSDLIAFLRALTDPAATDLRLDVPVRVPSGLTLSE